MKKTYKRTRTAPSKRRRKKYLKTSTKLSLEKSKKNNKRQYSKKYLALRNEVLLRDKYQCQMCNATGVKLEVHHVIRWQRSQAVRQNRRNLISLCKECHRSIRNKEEQYAHIFLARISKNIKRARQEKLSYDQFIKEKLEQEKLTGEDVSYVPKTEEEIRKDKKSEDYLRVTWRGIKRRIFDKTSNRYHRYGGRGIKMHEPWVENFQGFKDYILETIGHRPEGYSIDRIDNDGNYEPGNIRWASAQVQKQNNSQTKMTEEMVEVAFILFHKFKFTQRKIMTSFNLNNPTSIRNIVKGMAWNNITIKYKPIIKDTTTLKNMEEWENKNENIS